MPLPPDRIRALIALREVVDAAGWRCVLIGGSVPEVIVTDGGRVRPTLDADTIVSTPTWGDFAELRRALEARGFRLGDPHQMFSSEDVEVNLIPFGEGIADGEVIRWPDGYEMSALGLPEALETATPTEVDATLQIDVIPEPTFVLLKLISYQDRPDQRRRDVVDVVAACERYEGASERRYDVVGEVVDGEAVSFEEAGALLLGRDVITIAHSDSREALGRFFAGLADEYATPIKHVVLEERRTFLNEERLREVFRLFRLLQGGMGL